MEQKDPENVVSLPEELKLEKMDLTERIELLNAFKSIREAFPKLKKTSSQIERYINRQYIDWVDDNIKGILGEPKSQTFSDTEVKILKALASKVQQKQDAPPSAQPKTSNPAPNSKLTDGVDVAKYRKTQEEFLKQLEAMDRAAPEY